MPFGHVGILTVDLHLPDGSSLKTKRKELHRVKSALARRFACAVAEVDHHELWQRARLTLAVVGREAGETDERVSDALRMLHGDEAFQVVGEARELIAVSGDPTDGRSGPAARACAAWTPRIQECSPRSSRASSRGPAARLRDDHRTSRPPRTCARPRSGSRR